MQHDGQAVADQEFENLKPIQLLFQSLDQDRHAIAIWRGAGRKRFGNSMDLRDSIRRDVYIRILEDTDAYHTSLLEVLWMPKTRAPARKRFFILVFELRQLQKVQTVGRE